MALSCIFSKILVKNASFSYFTRSRPSQNFAITFRTEKMVGLPCFDTIHERDRQKDRQTQCCGRGPAMNSVVRQKLGKTYQRMRCCVESDAVSLGDSTSMPLDVLTELRLLQRDRAPSSRPSPPCAFNIHHTPKPVTRCKTHRRFTISSW